MHEQPAPDLMIIEADKPKCLFMRVDNMVALPTGQLQFQGEMVEGHPLEGHFTVRDQLAKYDIRKTTYFEEGHNN